jgi:FixJ family two-component response regulator
LQNAVPCVRVVDDDASVLKALSRLLRAAGFAVRTFPSPQVFLAEHDATAPGCLVLDLAMPGIDGLQLQQALARSADACPVVFISGRGDVASSVSAMKAGASGCSMRSAQRSKGIGPFGPRGPSARRSACAWPRSRRASAK